MTTLEVPPMLYTENIWHNDAMMQRMTHNLARKELFCQVDIDLDISATKPCDCKTHLTCVGASQTEQRLMYSRIWGPVTGSICGVIGSGVDNQ